MFEDFSIPVEILERWFGTLYFNDWNSQEVEDAYLEILPYL